MSEVMTFQPNPKQWLFLKEKHKHVVFGGARGGGKSWVVRLKASLLCNRFPGIAILIVRKSYPQLINNHINPLRKQLFGLATYNKQEKVFTFGNGSTITFRYCANDSDLDQYQGAQYDVIFIDEATQLRQLWIKEIVACCRGVNQFPKRIYYTCNPGGQSHDYFRRIVKRDFRENEDPEEYVFIQSFVTDNKALMEAQPDYVKQLENLPPKLRKAWLEGDWDIFDGAFFETFRDNPDGYKNRQWTHVIEPFTPRKHWPIERAIDWGFHRPFSVGYFTYDEQGVQYLIAQFYGAEKDRNGESVPDTGLKWPPDRVFAEIQHFESEHPYLAGRQITGVGDSAMWDAEYGVSIAETAEKFGIYLEKCDKRSRVNGWMQCQYRLMFDDNGFPMFYAFSTCKDFIRTIPMLQYDAHKAQDLDTTGQDHAADMWRYECMRRTMTPKVPEEIITPMFGADPLNQYKRR